VVALPEDMLSSSAGVDDAARIQPTILHPGPDLIAALRACLQTARRPLVLVGGSGWSERACADLARFIAANELPVACAFRNQDLVDNRDRHYAGEVGIGPNPKLAARVRDADVLLVIGERLGEMVTSGYSLLAVPHPSQTLIHVHPGADELGKVYQPALAIAASLPEACAALAAMPPVAAPAWAGSAAEAHADYLAWQSPRPIPGELDLWRVVGFLRDRLPEDAILVNGAGNYATWLHRLYRYPRYRTQLAPYSGSMGYGVPAAIAAKAVCPDRIVLSWNGDGCFLMNGQELATAVQYGLNVLFVVVDNGMYGTIRMHQEKNYPARVYGTDLANPDFAALARAYGAHGEAVRRTAEFEPAFERALAHDGPSLLHLLPDPQAITMNATIVTTLISANQYSNEPNTPTERALTYSSVNADATDHSHTGT
jgi:acetolactate synthase-1/2/3 large subunit